MVAEGSGLAGARACGQNVAGAHERGTFAHQSEQDTLREEG